jgi:hypothetical protein
MVQINTNALSGFCGRDRAIPGQCERLSPLRRILVGAAVSAGRTKGSYLRGDFAGRRAELPQVRQGKPVGL